MLFRGASADAFAAVADELSSATADSSTLGEELFSVAALLRSEPGLRRVATDVSLPAEPKQSLISGILGDKVDAGTLAVVASAVGRRWTAARDLADALEGLGVIAVVRSAGEDAGRLSDELFAVGRIVDENPDLRAALSDPARSLDDKSDLLADLLGSKTLPATVTLTRQAVTGSYRTVSVALEEFSQTASDVHGEGVATVRVANPLSDGDRERLGAALARQYHRQIHLNVVVEPHLIGGIRVEIGDDVIDGTVSHRLEDARRRLAV
jgi:F-type H+-transporting ATPase subunit delta